MDVHKNARLTVHGRERIVELLQGGQSVAQFVEKMGVTDGTQVAGPVAGKKAQ